MPLLPSLPTEVIENVIDEVTDSVQTLCSFSLTCRELLPRSHYHLFRSICLRDMGQLHSLYHVLDLYPRVAPLVVSVTLSTMRGDQKSLSLSLLEIIPTLLLLKLPHLRAWKITDQETCTREPRRWLSFSNPTLVSLRAHGAAIVQLHLDSVSLPNCFHFAHYIMMFRGLKHISCRSVHFKTAISSARLSQTKQRLVAQLQLSTLIIDQDVPHDATSVLLESSPSTLLDLQLHVQESTIPDVLAIVPQLHRLHSLTLTLQMAYDRDEQGYDAVQTEPFLRAYRIIKALSLHPNLDLRNLTVRLLDVRLVPLLDLILERDSSRRYDELKSVLLGVQGLRNIEVHHDGPRDLDLTLLLDECLPTLAGRQSVTFKCLTPSHCRQASHDSKVLSVAVSPDSKRCASGSWDSTIILWDTQRQTVVHEWIAHSDAVYSLAFSPDGRYLASGGRDRKVMVWDISSSRAKWVATLEGHSREVYACAWSPDGTVLISGSDDGTVRVWDAKTRQELHSLKDLDIESVWFVRFSPDGRWIASGGGSTSCAVWDTATGEPHAILHGHAHSVRSAAFDRATGRIATASDDYTVRLWDVETGEALTVLEGHASRVRDVAFSPGGRCVVSGSDDGTVKLWDSSGGSVLLSLKVHTGAVTVVCFSPDGKHIASASEDNTVRLWGADDGGCIRTFTEHTDKIEYLVYSLDGEILTSGGRDGLVCIRRLRSVVPEEQSEVDTLAVR